MVYEGVNFFEGPCSAMDKEEFIERHIGAFWQDRDEKTRRRMLTEAYGLIKPEKTKTEEDKKD